MWRKSSVKTQNRNRSSRVRQGWGPAVLSLSVGEGGLHSILGMSWDNLTVTAIQGVCLDGCFAPGSAYLVAKGKSVRKNSWPSPCSPAPGPRSPRPAFPSVAPGLVTCFSSSRLISPATHFVLVVFCGCCHCACQVLFSLKKGGASAHIL